MTYFIGALTGLIYGSLFCLLKYVFLWRPLLNGKRKIDAKSMPVSQFISMGINIITLLSIYFLRHVWPYSFEATLIAAAVALALIGQISPLRDVRRIDKLMKKQITDEDTEK